MLCYIKFKINGGLKFYILLIKIFFLKFYGICKIVDLRIV